MATANRRRRRVFHHSGTEEETDFTDLSQRGDALPVLPVSATRTIVEATVPTYRLGSLTRRIGRKGVKRSDSLTKDEKTESNTKAREREMRQTIGNNGQRARKFVQRSEESRLKRRHIMPAALATLTTEASRRGCAANG